TVLSVKLSIDVVTRVEYAEPSVSRRATSYEVAVATAGQETNTEVVLVAWASTLAGAGRLPQSAVVDRWLVMEQPFVFPTVTVRTTVGADGVNVIEAIFVADVIAPPLILHAIEVAAPTEA